MITHPSFTDLNSYADRELSEPQRARVATHLAGCTTCRSTVIELRRITAEAPHIMNRKPPEGALDRILERHAQGESVILPVADPTPRLSTGGMWRAAAAVVLAVATIVTVVTVQDVGAEFSNLNLSLIDRESGKAVDVEYESTSMFASHDRLVIRARYRIRGDELSYPPGRRVITAPLYLAKGGVFRGRVELPDSAVYAVFAVEDTAGMLVDSRGGELWDLLVISGGRPDYDALVQKQQDLRGRNWEQALETARLATQLYPENPEAWVRVSALEPVTADSAGQNRRTEHADRFARLEQSLLGSALSDGQLAWMYSYAFRAVPGSDRVDYWRNRLLNEAPRHPLAVQARVQGILQMSRSTDARCALDELEGLWSDVGSVHPELLRVGFLCALETGVADDIMKWADRRVAVEPWVELDVAEALATVPALRQEAIAKLRDQLARWDVTSSRTRALQSSVREHEIRRNALRRRAFASLGSALINTNQIDAGLDTLELAIADGWNTAAFTAMAQAKLALGDSVAAANMLANAAVDPNTSQSSADLFAYLGTAVLGDAGWQARLQTARDNMYRRTLAESSTRRVRQDVQLVGPEGRRYGLDDLTVGRVTLVVFWARYCAPCLQDLPALERVTERITDGRSEDDVHALIVTGEEPSVDVSGFIARQQMTVPLYHDVNRSAHRALGAWETPGYFLLDRAGKVRFSGTALEDVDRQVDALRSRDPR